MSAPHPTPRPLSGRLAGKSLPVQVAMLVAWPMAQQFLLWLSGAVDMSIAGHISGSAADALSVGTPTTWLMALLVMGSASGASVLVARATGKGHKGLARAALGQGMLLTLAVAVLLGLFVAGVAQVLVHLAGLSGDTGRLCATFLQISSLGLPLLALMFGGAAAMTASGDPRPTFFAMLVMNGINLAASIVLAMPSGARIGPATWHLTLPVGAHLGVLGIAWGQMCGWGVGALVILGRLLFARGHHLRLISHRLLPHGHTMRRIFSVSWPAMLERAGQGGGQWAILAIVGVIARESHTHLIAVHGVVSRIESLSYLPALAFGIAAATLTGQYLGADDPPMAKRAAKVCWFWGAGLMTSVGLLFLLVPGILTRCMTNQPDILAAAPPILRICGLYQFFFGSANILQGAMRGAGDTRANALWFNLLAWGVRLPLAALFGIAFGWGLMGIWIAIACETTLRGVVFMWRFFGGRWAQVKV